MRVSSGSVVIAAVNAITTRVSAFDRYKIAIDINFGQYFVSLRIKYADI